MTPIIRRRTAAKQNNIVIRRQPKRSIGVFIDGVGLDRASKRIGKRVSIVNLVKTITGSRETAVIRYYTILPNEDDSRQLSFLDSLQKQGVTIVAKRLPPKGIERQASTDAELSTDITAFAAGFTSFEEEYRYSSEEIMEAAGVTKEAPVETDADATPHIITVCVCRDICYPLNIARVLGAETTATDFGDGTPQDVLRAAAKWVDLSDATTIWMDEG